MNRSTRAAVALVALALPIFAGCSPKSPSEPVLGLVPSLVRETRTVVIGGQTEEWRLVWRERPRPECSADDVEGAVSCPCAGIAYGEYGHLDLQRRLSGKVVDSLALGSVYGAFDGQFAVSGGRPGMITLRRKPLYDDDYDNELASPGKLAAEVAHRPDTYVMRLADYDRDGRATEFLLQVGSMPCGKLEFAAVGVSRANPRLHVLEDAAHPNRPLAMPQRAWEALLRSGARQRVVTWECGDHISEYHTELELSVADGAISAKHLFFRCPFDPATNRRPDEIGPP